MKKGKYQPRDSMQSPRFSQPATFMRLPHVVDLTDVDIALVGIAYDGGTSYRPGARFGPREIREQSSLIRPYSGPQKTYPFDKNNVADCGDIDTRKPIHSTRTTWQTAVTSTPHPTASRKPTS